MTRIIKRHWPVVIAIGVLWITLIILLSLSTKRNEGHLVYALDDPYIHMAMAKNLVGEGVWGVTRYEFSSSSSSILWTLLLSFCYLLTGIHDTTPLILNIIFATLSIIAAYLILNSFSTSHLQKFLLLLGFIFLTPLPSLVMSGMEHSAQVLFCIIFVYLAAQVLSKRNAAFAEREFVWLLALASLVTLIRYEGLFLVCAACILFALQRRVAHALMLGALAIAPVGIYSYVSVRHGSLWLPNSILLKGTVPTKAPAVIFQHAILNITAAPHLLLLILLPLTLYFVRRRQLNETWERGQLLLLILIMATVQHLLFASVGWFYRYESYLVASGVLINGSLLCEMLKGKLSQKRGSKLLLRFAAVLLFVFVAATAALLIRRGGKALIETPQATTNIYEQQYQMGEFLRSYYEGASVAANDIGAINYMANIRCLDLFGLGSIDVARARLAGQFNTQKIYELGKSHDVRIAMVYSVWLEDAGGVPAGWIKVGEWETQNCLVCGYPVVSFYAVDRAEAETLAQNLRAFKTQLPAGVKPHTKEEWSR
ncbi:MAG: hypothetical protein WBP93_01905 [Pyrinomonadaceae bacterium]